MDIKLDLQLFAGDTGNIYIYSNDGLTLLYSDNYMSILYPIMVVSTGVNDNHGNAIYTYSGSNIFIGLAYSANATTPDVSIGEQASTLPSTTFYIVEQSGTEYKHILKAGYKVQVDSAIRDGNGVKIDTNYAKKSELPDVSGKMDKANPTGTGSFSLNRKANTTVGSYSFAEGTNNTASGLASHAEGGGTKATGGYSHVEGNGTEASGSCSHAEGLMTISQRRSQHVFGEYNVLDTTGSTTTLGNYVEIVGNGTGSSSRSNARTLDWSGNEVLAGSQTATSFIKSGGTSSQFLKADGSVDSNTYAKLSDMSNTVVHDDSSAVNEQTLLDNYYNKTQSDNRYIQANQINVYSTTEKVVGTFMGNTLYSKLYTFRPDVASWSNVTSDLQNYTLIDYRGFLMTDTDKGIRIIGKSEYPDGNEITRIIQAGDGNIGAQTTSYDYVDNKATWYVELFYIKIRLSN